MSAFGAETKMSPRKKLLLACIALACLLAIATTHGISAAAVARAALTVAAFAGLGFWWLRTQKGSAVARFQIAPRMSVVCREGLAPKTGLALVDIDGTSFLVVHGEGYAVISAPQDKKSGRAQRVTDSLPKFVPEGDR